MANNRVHFSSGNDDWATPEDVYDGLHAEFDFNFDPCPLHSEFDGLLAEWGVRNFCNPPYSKLKSWVEKAFRESMKGKLVVMLIPSRTDTIAWHRYVLPWAKEIRFLKGRLRFGSSAGRAPFPSCVVVFDGRE